MAKPLRSPKDEADQPKHTIGWLQRIFRFLVEWKEEEDNNKTLDRIIMNQAELAAGLRAIQTQATKVASEQARRFDAADTEIKRLLALLEAGGEVTTEVAEAMDGVKTTMQAFDDVIPDDPTPPPTP